jgi:hypothetical protein
MEPLKIPHFAKSNTNKPDALAFPDRESADFEVFVSPIQYKPRSERPEWVGFYRTSPIPMSIERKREDG